MGVALYGTSFLKTERQILNHIKSLDWYEIDLDAIKQDKISEIHLKLLQSIDVVLNEDKARFFRDFDIYFQHTDFSFYLYSTNFISGNGYKSEGDITYGLAFEPSILLNKVQNLIEAVNKWNPRYLGELNVAGELRSLTDLKLFLIEAIEKGGLVSFVVG